MTAYTRHQYKSSSARPMVTCLSNSSSYYSVLSGNVKVIRIFFNNLATASVEIAFKPRLESLCDFSRNYFKNYFFQKNTVYFLFYFSLLGLCHARSLQFQAFLNDHEELIKKLTQKPVKIAIIKLAKKYQATWQMTDMGIYFSSC